MDKSIILLAGRSASGKDSILSALLKRHPHQFTHVVSHTTRPMRDGEQNGQEYYFVTEEEIQIIPVVEERVYHTAHGDWHYAISQEELIYRLNSGKTPICILDLDGIREMKAWIDETYGNSIYVETIYIDCGSLTRLWRSFKRSGYKLSALKEIIRRLFADSRDFENAHRVCRFTVENSNNSLNESVLSILEIVGVGDE